MTYLGTDLTPSEYYKEYSHSYSNPHKEGVSMMLGMLSESIQAKSILDLGCGDGIVTSVLSKRLKDTKFIGIDNSQVMLDRYKENTGFTTCKVAFGDELPSAEAAIASYSLHLCEESKLAQMGVWLYSAGIKNLYIISPLKRPGNILCYTIKDYKRIHFKSRNSSSPYNLHVTTFEAL